MVEFETLRSEEKKFGSNSFIEVAKKKAITETGQNEFISVSRGFFTQDGSKRYVKNITIPAETLEFVIEKLKDVSNPEAQSE